MKNVKQRMIEDMKLTGLSEYDVTTLAGHASFAATHRFYLAVADDLVDRARQATTHQASQRLLQKCCQSSQRGARP